MPKPSSKRKSKQQSDSDSDSGPDDRNVKKSKNEGSSVDRDDEGNPRWMLENKRFITVRPFKGKVYIDIREFYEANGELKPGKKGIALTPTMWHSLKSKMDEIDDAIKQAA